MIVSTSLNAKTRCSETNKTFLLFSHGVHSTCKYKDNLGEKKSILRHWSQTVISCKQLHH